MKESAADRFIRVTIEKMNQEVRTLIGTGDYTEQTEVLTRIRAEADCVRFFETCIEAEKKELDKR